MAAPDKDDQLKLFLATENALTEIIKRTGKSRSLEILKQKGTRKFHQFRAHEFPTMLRRFASPSIPENPFVWQLVLDKLYLSLLVTVSDIPPQTSSAEQQRRLEPVEKNAIRYAAGYVIRKLMNKYKSVQTEVGTVFSECLREMVYDSTDLQEGEDIYADSFESYTATWLQKTDRGGLKHVTEESYWLFCEIELLVYDELKKNLTVAGVREKMSVVASLTSLTTADSDVQYIWSVISTRSEHTQGLLAAIIQEWIILRGHSLRNSFMEQYKRLVGETKREKSLRKELKRKSTEKQPE